MLILGASNARARLLVAASLVAAGGFLGCSSAPATTGTLIAPATATFKVPGPTISPTVSRTASATIPAFAASPSALSSTATATPPVTASPTVGISPEQAAQLVPLQPSEVTVTMAKPALLVRWRGTGEDVTRYEVYRKTAGAHEWQVLAGVAPVSDNRGAYEWRDVTATSGTAYVYGVAALNAYGKKSNVSESAAITAP